MFPSASRANRDFSPSCWKIPGWVDWAPGQFVMLRPRNWGSELTWARPFSISRVSPQSLVLFYQVVGRGTERIARLVSGDKVTIWGPLGTGFAVEAGSSNCCFWPEE